MLQGHQDRQVTPEQPANVDHVALLVLMDVLDTLDLLVQWVRLDHRDLLLQDCLESLDGRDLLELRDHPVCRVARDYEVI